MQTLNSSPKTKLSCNLFRHGCFEANFETRKCQQLLQLNKNLHKYLIPCISFPQYQLLNLVFLNKKKFSSCAHFISSAIKLSSPINLFIIIICTDPTCKRHHLVRQAEMIAEMFRESVSGQFNNAFYAQIMSCLKF